MILFSDATYPAFACVSYYFKWTFGVKFGWYPIQIIDQNDKMPSGVLAISVVYSLLCC